MSEPDEHISDLYRQSRDRLQPPRALDQLIVREAHRAIRQDRQIPYPALALAATVVIGVGLAWLQVGMPPGDGTIDQPMSIPIESSRLDDVGRLAPAPAARLREKTLSDDYPNPVAASTPARAKKSSPAAAAVSRPATAGALPTQKPTTAEMESATGGSLPCGLTRHPADDTEWAEVIEKARNNGDLETLRCLVGQQKAAADSPR